MSLCTGAHNGCARPLSALNKGKAMGIRSEYEDALALGCELTELARDQAAWSQATFGTDAERDGVGALEHLAREAKEAKEAALALRGCEKQCGLRYAEAQQDMRSELAGCLILLLDASRRQGVTPAELVFAAHCKMQVNKGRTWNKPTGDEPTEHVREGGAA